MDNQVGDGDTVGQPSIFDALPDPISDISRVNDITGNFVEALIERIGQKIFQFRERFAEILGQ